MMIIKKVSELKSGDTFCYGCGQFDRHYRVGKLVSKDIEAGWWEIKLDYKKLDN